MLAYLAEGLSAAEVARAALGGDASPTVGGLASPPAAAPAGSEPFAELSRALDAFDEPTAQAVPDRLMAELSLPAVLREVVLPYLADLGERWQRGTASIAAAPARASAVVWSPAGTSIRSASKAANSLPSAAMASHCSAIWARRSVSARFSRPTRASRRACQLYQAGDALAVGLLRGPQQHPVPG